MQPICPYCGLHVSAPHWYQNIPYNSEGGHSCPLCRSQFYWRYTSIGYLVMKHPQEGMAYFMPESHQSTVFKWMLAHVIQENIQCLLSR